MFPNFAAPNFQTRLCRYFYNHSNTWHCLQSFDKRLAEVDSQLGMFSGDLRLVFGSCANQAKGTEHHGKGSNCKMSQSLSFFLKKSQGFTLWCCSVRSRIAKKTRDASGPRWKMHGASATSPAASARPSLQSLGRIHQQGMELVNQQPLALESRQGNW